MKKDKRIPRFYRCWDEAPVLFDPNGSYTGIPKDPMEKPVQDADDL